MKRYRVTNQVHYIGGKLVYPDQGEASIVTLPPEVEPGRWLEEVDESSVAEREPKESAAFQANHVGGGNWEVLDANGERVGEMFRKADGDAKEKALEEADRLNSGDPGEDQELNANLPDA